MKKKKWRSDGEKGMFEDGKCLNKVTLFNETKINKQKNLHYTRNA